MTGYQLFGVIWLAICCITGGIIGLITSKKESSESGTISISKSEYRDLLSIKEKYNHFE